MSLARVQNFSISLDGFATGEGLSLDWINSLGVWAIDLLSLWMAAVLDPGLGLIAVYLTLVNAVSHIVVGAVKRKYNPGLITSFVLFLPVGGWAITAINAAWPYHLLALVVAICVPKIPMVRR